MSTGKSRAPAAHGASNALRIAPHPSLIRVRVRVRVRVRAWILVRVMV